MRCFCSRSVGRMALGALLDGTPSQGLILSRVVQEAGDIKLWRSLSLLKVKSLRTIPTHPLGPTTFVQILTTSSTASQDRPTCRRLLVERLKPVTLHLSSIDITQCNISAFVAHLLNNWMIKALGSPIALPMILDWHSESCRLRIASARICRA